MIEFHAPYVAASDTSRARATYEDSHGITQERWLLLLRLLYDAGTNGHTWAELADLTDLHHGQVSGSLSKLHEQGHVVQLKAKRNRSHIYIHAAHVFEFDLQDVNLEPVQTRANARLKALEAVAEAAHKLCYSQSANSAQQWATLKQALQQARQYE